MSDDTSVRLFCLPFEGASAGVFLPWAEALGSSVVVTPVELPGRGRHPRTRPCGRLEPLLAGIIPYVARMRDRPFALYGHGFGALLAYEIAARLEWEHDAVAERLYVSGTGVPHRAGPEHAVAQLPEAELLRRLGERGRIPRAPSTPGGRPGCFPRSAPTSPSRRRTGATRAMWCTAPSPPWAAATTGVSAGPIWPGGAGAPGAPCGWTRSPATTISRSPPGGSCWTPSAGT